MRRLCLLLVLGFALTRTASAEQNWPQFRGPTAQGISDAKNLPLEWGENKNVKWKTAIHGKAWSSPVIWGEQIWLSSATPDGKELSILCVDKNSGKILIDKVLFHVENPQFCHSFNSYASPTPIIEEGRIYVTFGSPGTACLDTKDGNVLWQRTDFECNHFRGSGSSPVLWNGLLIMNFDGSDYQYVAALDAKTGKTAWKTDRSIDWQDLKNGKPAADGDWRKAFSTPMIMMFEGKAILISVGSHSTYCYDPYNGKELWRTEYRTAHSGSVTPIVGDRLVYTCTGHGAKELWAIRPGGHGVVTDTNVVWRCKKKVPTRPSPILVNGLIYMVDDMGIVSCLDAKTGDEIFTGRIDGSYSASPLYADGRIYFFNEGATKGSSSQKGLCTVIEASREFKKLAENTLDSGMMGTPAVSGDALYVRTRTDLYRIENVK